MKAVAMDEHGGVEVLKLRDLPDPKPGAREVQVRVKAVALNHLDIWVRQGWPALSVEMPHIFGSDVSGVVEQCGDEVTDLPLGTEVVLSPGLSCGHCERCLRGEDNLCRQYRILGEHIRGGYAELVCVPRQNILPKPDKLSFVEAACIPLKFLTAWTMLVRKAQLRLGETVLVQAAGSGVGSAAVQIAKLLGAQVIATASTDAKLEKAKALGADHVVSSSQADVVAEVKRLTQRKGVDVVFEHVGGETFNQSIACLPYGGRLVTCGATAGAEVPLNLKVLFYKQISLLGSTMGSKGDLPGILRFVSEGKLKPVLDRVLPLKDAAHGHTLLEQRATFGNVVLEP